MSIPNVLLLTANPPSRVGIGGIFLSELCRHYPKENLCCFAVCRENYEPLLQDLKDIPIVYSSPPSVLRLCFILSRISDPFTWQRFNPTSRTAQLGKAIGSIFARVSDPFIWEYFKIQASNLISQAVQLGKENRIDIVWAVLDSPTTIYMAKRIAKILGVQLVTLVWDPPESFMPRSGLDKFFSKNILNEFKKTLKSAKKCGVASESMKEEYEDIYNVDSTTLIHGTHSSKWKMPAKELNNDGNFTIGFAGSLYAIQEWDALLSALSKVDWRICGRDVIIRLVGRGFKLGTKGKANIEYFGYRSVDETIELMSKADVAYLPYWFDKSYSIAVRLAFPNKLPTYLASGRPVLFHGPENSSPTLFFRKFPVGLCCHSLEESEIIRCLERFITDKDFYASATEAGHRALTQELNLDIFLSHFAELIGISREKLLYLN
jgi:hypothetical protein